MSNLSSRSGIATRSLPHGTQPVVLATLELTRGDSLYRRGDPTASVYRVEAGLLKLFLDTAAGRERIVGVAGPGDLIGAVNILSEVSGENAEALSSSVKVSVLANNGSLTHEARLEALSRQQHQLLESIEDGELPVPARLARTLARLAERFGQHRSDGHTRLTLPLTHDNLAAMIGAARETTSFALAEMRRAGVLQGTRGIYTLRIDALRDYAAANAG